MTPLVLFLLVAFASANPPPKYENNHLVTMRKAELMMIIDCISQAKNPVLCEKLMGCEKMLPEQVCTAYEKCQKECMDGTPKCSLHEPMFPSPDVPSRIFDCIVRSTHRLTPEEKKEMVNFEECGRELYAKNCKRPTRKHNSAPSSP